MFGAESVNSRTILISEDFSRHETVLLNTAKHLNVLNPYCYDLTVIYRLMNNENAST